MSTRIRFHCRRYRFNENPTIVLHLNIVFASFSYGFQPQGVDLACIQTGISGVFCGVLNFENLYFLGTGQRCCIFLSCQINAVFLSVLCLQRYF